MELYSEIVLLLDVIKKLDQHDKENLNHILEQFKLLDENRKIELLKYIHSSSLLKLDFYKSEDAKFDCQTNGHTFSEWEIALLSKYGDDNDLISYWKRTCTKCGLIDVSSINPIESENRANKL